MGIISKGILGGFSGKVGTVVGFSTRGIECMRAYNAHITNPKTAKQLAVRARVKGVVALASKVLTPLIHPIWKKEGKLTGYNRFFRRNYPAFGDDGVVSDPKRLSFSMGGLSAPVSLQAQNVAGTPGKVTLTWPQQNLVENDSADDKLNVVAFCNGNIKLFLNMDVLRSAGTASVDVPFATGDTVYFYAFFSGKDGKDYSGDCNAVVILS